MRFKILLFCFTVFFTPAALIAEWGAEASVGGNPTAYFQDEIKKQNSSYRTQVSGRRHALSFTGKLYYEWIGLRLWADTYFAGTGKQKTQSSVSNGNGGSFQQSSEQDGTDFSSVQTWRGELQLRKFYYGHRELFSFNFGLLYRKVTTELTGQPSDYAPGSALSRYMTLGITFEPLLTNFGRYELSLPIDLSVGLKFPEGGIFSSGAGPGAVFFGTGLRLQVEPRGAFLTTQGVVNFHDAAYAAAGGSYTLSQVEVSLRIMAGYYFRNPVYHE